MTHYHTTLNTKFTFFKSLLFFVITLNLDHIQNRLLVKNLKPLYLRTTTFGERNVDHIQRFWQISIFLQNLYTQRIQLFKNIYNLALKVFFKIKYHTLATSYYHNLALLYFVNNSTILHINNHTSPLLLLNMAMLVGFGIYVGLGVGYRLGSEVFGLQVLSFLGT